MTIGLILEQIFVEATTISLLWIFAWVGLAFTMLHRPIPKKRMAFFVAIYLVVQWAYNLLIIFWMPEERFYLIEITVFTFQLVLLLLVFCWKNKGLFARLLAASSLGYILVHSFLLTVGFIARPINEHIVANIGNGNLGKAMFLSFFYSNGLYLIVFAYTLFLRFAIRKTKFPLFFDSLFNSRFKATATCVVCFLLMHSARIVNLLVPEASLSTGYYAIIVLLDILFLLLLLFISVFETNREKLRAQEALLVQQQAYTQTLERLQAGVRAFRHDYQNMMSGLWLQASEGDLAGVQQQVKDSLHYFDENIGAEIKQANQVGNIQIPELKSLVMVKLMEMRQRGIEAQLEVLQPVTRCAMDIRDLLRCLGILLDNAIEAAVDTRHPWVSLVLLQEGGDLSLVVSNPVDTVPSLHQLAKPGYTTKGAGHGTGLASLRTIVGGYRAATTKTTCENGVFQQQLRIRRKK